MLCDKLHMVVGAKVCELTDGFLLFVCGLYVGILTSHLRLGQNREVSSTGEQKMGGIT